MAGYRPTEGKKIVNGRFLLVEAIGVEVEAVDEIAASTSLPLSKLVQKIV